MNRERLIAVLDAGQIEWTRHVLRQMGKRNVEQEAVLEVLRSSECIEEYPEDFPYPSALFLGWVGGRPLHIVAALDERRGRIHVITVYEPDHEHFESDYRTRRRP